jgi:GNAT superfamily N-acetyltransferase
VIKVRAVNGADPDTADLLDEMQKTCLPADDLAETEYGYWWIAYDGEEPAAFCGLYHSRSVPGAGYLARAGVLPEYRGHGLQRRLIRVRERKARKLGMKTLVSDTFNNPQSSNNLIACGYRMYDPENPWGISGTCYWIKNI